MTATNATNATSATTAQTAATAANADYATTADTATTATNAANLGRQPASAYLRRGAADFAVLGAFQVAGPLPKSFSVTSHGGRLLLFVSGSAYGTADGPIGVAVALNGLQVALMQISVNETLSHKTLAPVLVSRVVAAGTHTVTLTAVTGNTYTTGTDNYDVFNVTALELPIP